MNKRAGRRVHRNGSQRHPPGATQREPTIERDDLPSEESLHLELQSLSKGWLQNDEKFAKYRDALMMKTAALALKENADPKFLVAALRAISMAELRQQQNQIQSIGLQLRRQELPAQVNVQVNNEIQVKPLYSVVQELIARKEVRQALDRIGGNDG